MTPEKSKQLFGKIMAVINHALVTANSNSPLEEDVVLNIANWEEMNPEIRATISHFLEAGYIEACQPIAWYKNGKKAIILNISGDNVLRLNVLAPDPADTGTLESYTLGSNDNLTFNSNELIDCLKEHATNNVIFFKR